MPVERVAGFDLVDTNTPDSPRHEKHKKMVQEYHRRDEDMNLREKPGCKKREDSRKAGKGTGRPFVPWCKD